jgi:hypothetical protein
MHISITAINFHDGSASYSFNVQGSHGFELPAGHHSATVDFKIEEPGGSYITLTEIISGRSISSYDELVKIAFRQVAQRLERFGVLAKQLKEAEASPSESVHK